MTSQPQPQCLTCDRWVSPQDRPDGKQTCTAYPDGIPTGILTNRVDHRQPAAGDRGLTWTPHSNAEFPEWALATELLRRASDRNRAALRRLGE